MSVTMKLKCQKRREYSRLFGTAGLLGCSRLCVGVFCCANLWGVNPCCDGRVLLGLGGVFIHFRNEGLASVTNPTPRQGRLRKGVLLSTGSASVSS